MSKSKPEKTPPAEKPDATENEKVKRTHPVLFWQLKVNTVKKLGKQAVGGISYQFLTDSERQILSIRITANFGGGYFSREIMPFDVVKKACLDRQEADKSFASKILKECFVSRSANNSGFLAALLRAEGLLSQAPNSDSKHIASGDWNAFAKTMLAEPGEQIEIDLPMPVNVDADAASDTNLPAQTNARKTLTVKRPKTEPPTE